MKTLNMPSDTSSPTLISKFPKIFLQLLLAFLLINGFAFAFAHDEDDKNHDDGDRKHKDKILLKTVSDAPDPFSAAVAGTAAFHSEFAVRETDGLNDAEGRKKRFFIEQTLRITDAAAGTEQVTLKGETEVLPGHHQDEDDDGEDDDQIIPVSVQQLWDGRDAQGNIVLDGLYRYEVQGQFVRVKFKTHDDHAGEVEDNEKIKVIDTSSVLTGGITIDNTPPVISNVQPADGSLLAVAAPTVAGVFADNLSGINITSVKIVLDGVDVTTEANVTAAGFNFIPAGLADNAHTLSINSSSTV